MTELRALLDDIAGNPRPPLADVVAADLSRGRRALIRQKAVATSAGMVLAVAAATFGLVVLPQFESSPQQTNVVAPAAKGASDAPTSSTSLIALVPYDGPLNGAKLQPGLVPAGWTVGGDAFDLIVAPPGEKASVDQLFTDKILVYLDEGIPNEPRPDDEPIDVGGRTGYIISMDPSALQIYLNLPNGVALRAQAPLTMGWDHKDLARFLAGVAVLEGATAGNG